MSKYGDDRLRDATLLQRTRLEGVKTNLTSEQIRVELISCNYRHQQSFAARERARLTGVALVNRQTHCRRVTISQVERFVDSDTNGATKAVGLVRRCVASVQCFCAAIDRVWTEESSFEYFIDATSKMQIAPCPVPLSGVAPIDRSDGEYAANVYDQRADSFTVHQSEFADFPQQVDYDAESSAVRTAVT